MKTMIRATGRHAVLLVALWVALCTALAAPRAALAGPPGELWASDSLEKVLRTAAPPAHAGQEVRLSGSRGEVVSGQAVFRAAEDVVAASARIGDLKHRDSAALIPGGRVQLQWVRYIDVSRNSAGLPEEEQVAKAPTSLPDPYWEGSTISVAAAQAQPIWLEVAVPQDAQPGDYEGRLTVTADDMELSLAVVLHVWDFDLPQERHLSVINWGVFPGQLFPNRAPKDDADYLRLFHEYCAFLVAHRQTDLVGSLDWIEPQGQGETGVTFDTSRLEQRAEVAFDAGIRRIHLHAAGNLSAPILDPASRVKVPEQRLAQLKTLEQTIQRRGWQDRFLVDITDEPFIHHEETYAAAVDLVHEAAPSVRIIEAVETEYLGRLDIYVPKLSHLNLWYPHFERQRREQGGELWFYTCCHPAGRYPNRFLDQSLLKVRVLHWINYLYDLDGYLHWGLNHYGSDDPYSEAGISKDLPLGDRAIIYPGEQRIIGSLRFSAQRDGLQDYEYLRLLEHRLQAIRERVGADAFWLDPRQRPLELCRRVIWSFHDYTRDPQQLWQTRQAIAQEIESLGEAPLLVVQTSPPEGTPIPAGPRMVNVRGLVPPGATVELNGKPVANVRPSGYFSHYWFPSERGELTVTVDHEGRRRSASRMFPLVD